MSYTVQEAITAAVEEYGEPLSCVGYTDWRDGVDRSPPTKRKILRQVEATSWEEACTQLGIEGITRKSEAHYSIPEIKSAMYEAAQNTDGPLNRDEYSQHYSDTDGNYPDDVPSPITVENAVGEGSWQRACERLGIMHTREPGKGGRWTEKALQYYIRQAKRECDGELTRERYEQWRQEAPTTLPAAKTLIDYLIDNPWEQVLQAAFGDDSPVEPS